AHPPDSKASTYTAATSDALFDAAAFQQ
ncbi:MAG: hypothetical protein QOJ56_5282, partial [Mycobacterium sp.]|nr:hypothetical protein [Mycobacterium sp.]